MKSDGISGDSDACILWVMPKAPPASSTHGPSSPWFIALGGAVAHPVLLETDNATCPGQTAAQTGGTVGSVQLVEAT